MQYVRCTVCLVHVYSTWPFLLLCRPIQTRPFYWEIHHSHLGNQLRTSDQQNCFARTGDRLIGLCEPRKACWVSGTRPEFVGSHLPRRSATSGLLWYLFRRRPTRQNCSTPSELLLLVFSHLFDDLGSNLFMANHLSGRFFIRNPGRYPGALPPLEVSCGS